MGIPASRRHSAGELPLSFGASHQHTGLGRRGRALCISPTYTSLSAFSSDMVSWTWEGKAEGSRFCLQFSSRIKKTMTFQCHQNQQTAGNSGSAVSQIGHLPQRSSERSTGQRNEKEPMARTLRNWGVIQTLPRE